MAESMFGKRERLYADTRTPERNSETPPPAAQIPAPSAPRPRILDVPPPPQQPARRIRGPLSSALEIAGVGAVSVGGFLVAPWLGCMMLGVLLIVLGVAIGYGP